MSDDPYLSVAMGPRSTLRYSDIDGGGMLFANDMSFPVYIQVFRDPPPRLELPPVAANVAERGIVIIDD